MLAQEAIRQKLYDDPEVVEAARRVMVQQLLKKELDQNTGAVTDAEVARYYQAHRADYVKPAMTRLSHIALNLDNRTQAEALLKQVKELNPLDAAGFGALARAHSQDERTKELDGDMRFLSDEEISTQYGPELAAASAQLVKTGDVFDALVETKKAFHIVKLQARQQPLNLTVEQAKPSIVQVLANESKQERFRALLNRLNQNAHLELNESALSAITVDPKAPSVPATAPSPGFIPAPPSMQ